MGKIRCNLTFGDSLLFLIGWALLIIVTFGLAAPFFILSFSKYLINRSILVENNFERQLSSNLSIGGDFVYLILWTVLSLITFGIAGIFFIFSLGKRVMNSVEVG